jgi:asparaginyl-tRNA synthetase
MATDLLMPGLGELVGGSLREDDPALLESRMAEAGTLESLQWYLELRKYGHAPLGGFGLGVERFVQYLLDLGSIKDAIGFPRWPHHCQM